MRLNNFIFDSFLFFLLPGRLMIIMAQTKGLSLLSMCLSACGLLLLIIAFVLAIIDREKYKITKNGKFLIALFIIYSLYIFYYLFVSPQLDIEAMRSVPNSMDSFISMSIRILIMISLVGVYPKYVNWRRFYRITSMTIGFLLVVYWITTSPGYYIISRGMSELQRQDYYIENHIIEELTLGRYAGMCFIFCLVSFKDSISRLKLWYFIFAITSVFTLVILMERGPLLFLITSTALFYYLRTDNRNVNKRIMFFLILILSIFVLLYLISIFAPEFYGRITGVIEDGGSGRFGNSDSVYNCSWQVFMRNPLWGSYFRIVGCNAYTGYYAHNIILELFMTFGCIFTIPMLILIFKACKFAIKSIKNKDCLTGMSLYFIYILSTLMTSGTIVINYIYWFSFAIMLSYPIYNRHKRKCSVKNLKALQRHQS